MQTIHANKAASITELKKNPSRLIENAAGEPVAILNHNTAAAYLIPSSTYERILEKLDDYEIESIVRERLNDGSKPVRVNIDEI